MTRVIFYTDIGDRQKFLFRFLYRKIFKAHSSALVYADEALITRLDDVLWEEKGFLPHSRLQPPYKSSISTPITLVSVVPDPDFHSDVLISLTDVLPTFIGRFPLYVDIVGQTTKEKAAARARYKYLKDHGYPIDVHRLSNQN